MSLAAYSTIKAGLINSDWLGYSVALSDDKKTLLFGAYEDNAENQLAGEESSIGAGLVYVYGWDRNTFSLRNKAILTADRGDSGDNFGYSLAISANGNTIAVGAFGEDSKSQQTNQGQSDNSTTDAGAIYVFVKQANGWAQQAYLKSTNANAYDFLGTSLTLNSAGDLLASGAYGESSETKGINGDGENNSAGQSGAVYLYQRVNDHWMQKSYIKASNTDAGDRFGYSVALSAQGAVLAVGAFSEASAAKGIDGNEADNSAPNAGAVYLFEFIDDQLRQASYIKSPKTHMNEWFGHRVYFNKPGNRLFVGAMSSGENSSDHASSSPQVFGATYEYLRADQAWRALSP